MKKLWGKTGWTTAAGAALMLAFTGIAAAAPEKTSGYDAVMDKVVVSARGVESRISQTPGGVGILDAETLKTVQPVSVTDALKRIAGVDFSGDSRWGAEVNIRGLGRNRVVFLIDGCRVNTATEINAQFGLIAVEDIERVEVLKGPISSLYGSGSIGGVVNVITKKGNFSETTEYHGTLSSAWSSNTKGFRVFAGAEINTPKFWAYVSGGHRDHDSYEDGNGDTVHNSQFEDTAGNVKAGYRWNDRNETLLQYQYLKAKEIGIPGSGKAAMPPVTDVTYPDTWRALANLTHTVTPASDLWKTTQVNLYFQEIDRNVRIDKLPPVKKMKGIFPSANHTTWGVKWFNAFAAGDHAFSIGADAWEWAIDSTRKMAFMNGNLAIDQPLADAEQFSGGIFGEDNWQITDRFSLNFGGRLDMIKAESDDLYTWIKPPAPMVPNPLKRAADDYDDTSWDARAGLTFNVTDRVSMTLLGGSSYRAPGLMERFKYIVLGSFVIYGNPELDPERSLFAEYGLHYTTNTVSAGFNAYVNSVDDLIVEKVINPDRHEMANVDEARIHGAEAYLDFQVKEDWRVYSTIAWTRGENKTADTDLGDIPPLNGMIGCSLDPSIGLSGGLELVWADHQSHTAAGEAETPGWATVNARLGYRFTLAGTVQELSVRADNLLDKTYRNHLSTSRKPAERFEPGLNVTVVWKMDI